MRNIIRETTETTTTLTTLAQLMEQRRVQRAEEERERQEQTERNAKDRADEQIEWLAGVLADRLSQQTRDALSLTYNYHRDDDDTELEYAYAIFTSAGMAWEIRYHKGWYLNGAYGYSAMFEYGRYGNPFDAKLLDALDGYPAWIEQQQIRAATETEPLPIRRTIPHYRQIESTTMRGILHPNAHITVWMVPATSDEREQQTHYTGRVESYNDRWLLLTCDGPSQRQRLIQIARIDEIMPEPEETEETPPVRDDIPF